MAAKTTAAQITKVGPVVVVQDADEETVATMQVCYNQANQSSCVLTLWEIDGFVKSWQLSGTNQDWPRFWSTFLDLLPQHLADDIATRDEECDCRL
jgi:hypothetical protein